MIDRWALRASAIPANHIALGGSVNFTVMSWTSSGKVTIGGFGERDIRKPEATQSVAMIPMASAPLSSALAAKVRPNSCYNAGQVGKKKLVDDVVGETFSSKKAAWQTFTYGRTANSTLGFGISYKASSGKWGDWQTNAGDTKSETSTASVQYGTKHGRASIYYVAEFWGAIDKFVCPALPGHSKGVKGTTYKQTEIIGFTASGFRRQVKQAPWNAEVCAYQGGGQTVTITKTTALTWSDGLDFSSLGVDIGLSTQTGYTTDAATQNHWYSRGHFCGVNAPPNIQGALINVER